jgi:hypothetical protein
MSRVVRGYRIRASVLCLQKQQKLAIIGFEIGVDSGAESKPVIMAQRHHSLRDSAADPRQRAVPQVATGQRESGESPVAVSHICDGVQHHERMGIREFTRPATRASEPSEETSLPVVDAHVAFAGVEHDDLSLRPETDPHGSGEQVLLCAVLDSDGQQLLERNGTAASGRPFLS